MASVKPHNQNFFKSRRSSLIAAVFLMATSAIGPGFITQTASFTSTMGAAFAFGILISTLIDFVVQLNIWRILSVTRMKAPELANLALPGSGYLLAILVFSGGLIFNIGNIAGAGLGLSAFIGLNVHWGAILSAALTIGIFACKHAGIALDRLIIGLGIIMIALTGYVAFVADPPVAVAFHQLAFPDSIDFATITTIVGSTVGGYITYSGAHRLLDNNITGPENIKAVSIGALSGVAVAGIMRFLLFLVVLGVVTRGVDIDIYNKTTDPAAQAFEAATDELGLRIFGLVLWGASITSIIGAAYTCSSFTTVFSEKITASVRHKIIILFILVSLFAFLSLGTTPSALIIFVSGLNGLILPIGLSIFVMIGWTRADLMGDYEFSRPLLIMGSVVCALTWYMSYESFNTIFEFLSM